MATRFLISVTEIRRNTARVIEQVRSSPEPIFITQYGYVTAVLLAPQRHETLRAAARLKERRILGLLNGPYDSETARLINGEEHEE